MPIFSPKERIWWNEPIEKSEVLWVTLGLVWSLVMFFMMPYWHMTGNQNLSNEAYKIRPEVFAERTAEFAAKYTVREKGDTGMTVVHPHCWKRHIHASQFVGMVAGFRTGNGAVRSPAPVFDRLAARVLLAARKNQPSGYAWIRHGADG